MLECLNKRCGSNRKNKCILNDERVYIACASKEESTHTPRYAEEQLNNAIEKENKNHPNWETEYYKLKEENKRLKEEAEKDNKRLRRLADVRGEINNKYEDEIDKLRCQYEEKIEKLKNQNTEYFVHWGEAESKAKKQEREIEELKESNKSLALIIAQGNNEIVRLKTEIERTTKLVNIIEKVIDKL